jgi:hypothetical protein
LVFWRGFVRQVLSVVKALLLWTYVITLFCNKLYFNLLPTLQAGSSIFQQDSHPPSRKAFQQIFEANLGECYCGLRLPIKVKNLAVKSFPKWHEKATSPKLTVVHNDTSTAH